jgi:hypothetical protein
MGFGFHKRPPLNAAELNYFSRSLANAITVQVIL